MGVTGTRERRRVRVWFDDEPVIDRTVDPTYAKRLAASMWRQFVSLRVTNDSPKQAAIERQLMSFAQQEGYTLDLVYVAHPDTAPAAFDALLNAVRQQNAAPVVVSTPQDLSPLGTSLDMTDQLERTGPHVLMAGPAP